jgi:hypothetical protein
MQSTVPSKLEQIRATFPMLDSWGGALANSFVPTAGSELSIDDMDWPPVPVSQVAVMGLGSARDHLHAVRVHIDAGQLFPFAQSTLIRGALVGAAQAVWVLSPEDRDERIERGRCVAAHMYSEHRKYLDLLRGLALTPHEETEAVAAHVQQRQATLNQMRALDGHKASLNTTDMVKEAALDAFGTQALANEALSSWRLTSGAAHGFAWPLLGQPDSLQSGVADKNGIAPFAAAGGIDRIANDYLCSYHLAKHGWSLLDARSQTAT